MGGDSASRPARTLAERTADELGPPTILVNNAGQASRGRSVEHTSHEEYMHLYQVHVLAAAEACAAVLPGMRRAGGGSIAFISSVVARGLGPGSAPYAMAKAAGEALASVLSFEERPHGIRVNTVAPRLVSTEMGDRLVRASLAGAASSAGELSSSTFARLLMIPVEDPFTWVYSNYATLNRAWGDIVSQAGRRARTGTLHSQRLADRSPRRSPPLLAAFRAVAAA